MKFIDLFSGIGGFRTGMEMNGHECVAFCEIDKYARQSYKAMYETEGEEEIHDITKWTDGHIRQFVRDRGHIDVICGGFPCQSFSIAGKRGGFDDVRGTLFFEVARIADEKKPKVLLLENVKGLVGHDKGKTLDTIVKTLNDIGYRVDFEVLNSKYFGVPQNRERIFIVAIREDLIVNEPWNIVGNNVVAKGKKRISGYDDVKTFNFDFPKNETVTKRLVDILEDNVDEKFYLDEEKTKFMISRVKTAGVLGNTSPQIADYRYDEGLRIRKDNNSPTLRANMKTMGNNSVDMSNTIYAIESDTNIKIRKLTPLECFRLQGFTDEQFYKAKNDGVSDSQLYKQAGNSVTVNVIDAIAKRL